MDNQELLKRAFFKIQKLEDEKAELTGKYNAPIAVVGIGCKFPGNVQNVQDYWNLITSKTDATQGIPAERWEELIKMNPAIKETIRSKNGGYLDRVDLFDASFFNITPREAKLMDPQHRFLLEVAWEAIEHGNLTIDQLRQKKTGVFVGMTLTDYGSLTIHESSNDTYGLSGSAMNASAGRVAYLLGFNGPAIMYDTACSSSLVALDGAIKSLRSGDADYALAGGVNLITGPNSTIFIDRAGMSSPDGHCYSFDERASGMSRGEGCGMVVLKRLSDAIADGDTIYSVIREAAINNNGSGSGFTVPNGAVQTELMQSVYASTSLSPADVDYVEAHGTGTALGDPIEINALHSVYDKNRPADRPLYVGSVKTNMGHLESAAGIAGFIKATLALYNKQIPPQLFFDTPNKHIDWDALNIRISTENREWKKTDGKRMAAVSSFGASGTNAHVVLEEFIREEPVSTINPAPAHLLTISAKNEQALRIQAEHWLEFLQQSSDEFSDICYTSNIGRTHLASRLAIVAMDRSDATDKLSSFLNGEMKPGIVVSSAPLKGKTKTAWLFTGQGAQYVQMGKTLYESYPVFREALDQCDVIYKKISGLSIIELIQTSTDSKLDETEFTQPALFCLEFALARLWQSWGMQPDVMIGHSVGEYVAACISGVFDLEMAIQLITKRAQLIQALPKDGSMAVLFTNMDQVQPYLSTTSVNIAAINSPENVVISGKTEAVNAILEKVAADGIKSKLLTVSHAFHSSLMQPMIAAFKEQFIGCSPSKPVVPIISNVTSKIESDRFTSPDYWCEHILQAVRFGDDIRCALDLGINTFVEIGPTPTLVYSGKQNAGMEDSSLWVHSLRKGQDDILTLLSAVAELHVNHFPVNWNQFHQNSGSKKVAIPVYTFLRESYWVKARAIQSTQHIAADTVAVESLSAEATKEIAPENRNAFIVDQLTKTLSRSTDLDPAQMDHHANFFETGLDSVVLVTIKQEIERQFKVPIAMGMFYEETANIQLLANYIESKAPESVFVLREQAVVRMTPASSGETVKLPDVSPSKSTAFVPYKKISAERSSSLNAQQQKCLDTLCRNLNQRTQNSKIETQRHRKVLANNRSVAGFKPEWKEFLYQIITERANGSKIWDIDGNEYIDLTMGFGVQLFGHNQSFIMSEVQEQLNNGFTVGPMSNLTGTVAEKLCNLTNAERAAFYNSGTEAIMVAMRLARTYTNRTKIVIFAGSYHGTFDGVLAISGGTTTTPMVPGTTQGTIDDIVVLKYGDQESLKIIESLKDDLAGIIIEPVQSRRPDIQPKAFIHALKAITEANDCALIFDEVITGFRVHPQGAQGHFGVQADIATYGKVIGGGLPIGIVAGKSKYLDAIDGGHWKYGDQSYPSVRTTFAAGTFCHHPLALAAANAVLDKINASGSALQESLNEKTRQLTEMLNAFFVSENIPIKVAHFSSLFRFVLSGNSELLFYKMLEKGVYVWEGRNCFLSTAHTDNDIQQIIRIVQESALELRDGGLIESIPVKKQQVSATQNRVFLLSQSEKGEQGYHLPEIFTLTGSVNPVVIENVFRLLIERHENLRSSFVVENGEVMQQVHPQVYFTLAQEQRFGATPEELVGSITEPFDLSEPSLIRVKLVEINPDEYRLLLNVHHIVFDGFSMANLLNEFMELYQGYVLPPLTTGYQDFVAWETAYKNSAFYQQDQSYWKSRFETGVPQLELPTDYPRSLQPDFSGHSVHLVMDEELTAELKAFARSLGVSMYTFTLAAYYLLLYRYSGQKELVIGTPVSGRPDAAFRKLIGMFVNTLALPESIEPEQRISDFIKQVSKACLTAFEHENYPFDELYNQLEVERQPNRNPLFDAMFVYESHDSLSVDLGDLQITWTDAVRQTAKFDLTIEIQDSNRLDVYFNYKRVLFRESTIQRLSGYFRNILSSMVKASEQPVKRIGLLDETDQHELLYTFNATETVYDHNKSLIDLFEEQVAKTPLNNAIVDGEKRLSFAELNAQANYLITRLQDRYSVGEGDLIALFVPRSTAGIAGALAALKGTCAFLFLDVDYPADRIRYMLEDSSPKVILSFEHLFHLIPDSEKAKLIDISNLSTEEIPNGIRSVQSENPLAYVIYTSGSTGKPKGTLIHNRSIVNYITGINKTFGFTEKDSSMHLLSNAFDGSFTYIWSMLTSGGTLHMISNDKLIHPEIILDYVSAHQITFIKWIPTYFKLICQHEKMPDGAFDSLRVLMLGGEPVNAPDVLKFRAAYPEVRLFDHYGPTEATVGCIGRWMTDDVERYAHEQVIGKPFDNVTAYIFNENLQLQPIGAIGELYIGGDSLAYGYKNQPEMTAERFIPNPYKPEETIYKTGDIAYWLPDGDIVFAGRADHQVKIRGYRVETGEIKNALLQLEYIEDAHIVTRKTGGSTELIAYFIGKQEITPVEIRKSLLKFLPDYMVPAHLLEVPSFPFNKHGKIDTAALPTPDEVSPTGHSEEVLATTPNELLLTEIWRAVLNRNTVGIDDNYFMLGGDSIKSIQIISRLNTQGWQLRMDELFESPTIRQLALLMQKNEQVISQERVTGTFALTPVQYRFFRTQKEHLSQFNMSFFLRSEVLWNVVSLEQAIDALVEHHDTLRTTFDSEQLQQTILPVIEIGCQMIQVEDLASLDSQLEAVQQQFDVQQAPLIRVVLFDSEAGQTLFISLHHLVSDAISCGILLEDFISAYQQAQNDRAIVLPKKTHSFRDWSEYLHQVAGTGELAEELEYWKSITQGNYGPIPYDQPCEKSEVGQLQRVKIGLSKELTASMRTSNAVFRTKTNELLLTALGKAVGKRFRIDELPVMLEGHGREPMKSSLNVGRTIGWFTSYYPVIVPSSANLSGADFLKSVKERLRTVPGNGIGFDILKQICREQALDWQPQIKFNYLGDIKGTSVHDGISIEENERYNMDPRMHSAYDIEIIAMETGDELQLELIYHSGRLNTSTIEQLGELIIKETECLIQEISVLDSEKTPSDFTWKKLTLDRYNEILTTKGLSAPEVENIYPLSPMQETMLFHSQKDEIAQSFAQIRQFTIEGKLDCERLKASWYSLLDRHESLRMMVVAENQNRPLQLIPTLVDKGFSFMDLSGLDAEKRYEILQDAIQQITQQPFDLLSGNLTRFTVFKLEEELYQIVWYYHHIVQDGWSSGVLLDQLFSAYDRSGSPVLQKGQQYSDYMHWHQQQDSEQAEQFWRTYLQGLDRKTAVLPSGNALAGADAVFENLTFQLDEEITSQLTVSSRSLNITLNTMIQGIWSILCARYSGSPDIVFGSTVSGRPSAVKGVEGIVGLFINTIPVRVNLDFSESFGSFARNLQQQNLSAESYHHYSLADIQSVSALKHELLDHVLIFENYPLDEEIMQHKGFRRGDLFIDNIRIEEASPYNLSLEIVPGKMVHFKVTYNSQDVDRDFIERIQEDLMTLLTEVAKRPNQSVQELEMLLVSAEEMDQQQVLLNSINEIDDDF